jgi:hypothetical protein
MAAANLSTPITTTTGVETNSVTHALAAELAAGLMSKEEIMSRFGLTKPQLAKIVKDQHFRTLYKEAKAIWGGTGNVKERIRAKAALLLEDSLLPLYAMIHNLDCSPTARIEAFTKLMVVSDMQPQKGADAEGKEGFTLNISFGGQKKSVTIDSKPAKGLESSDFSDVEVSDAQEI